MLNAYSTAQTIPAGALVPFTSVALHKGMTATLSGQNTIQLNRAGVYRVDLVLSGVPAAAGAVTVTMTKDGVPQPQATVTDPLAVTTIGVTLPVTTLVQVSRNNGSCCCREPVVLAFELNGVGLNQAQASVVVTRIC